MKKNTDAIIKAVREGEDKMSTESQFERLSRDFNQRKPAGAPLRKTFWFESNFQYGSDSTNDLLRRFLINNGIEYLNMMGEVWFIWKGTWCRCDYKVSGDTVKFYLCEFNPEVQA